MMVSAAAAQKIAQLCGDSEFFRVQVKAGGCSGFEQAFSITTQFNDHDIQMGQVVLDADTDHILKNAILDWRSDLSGSQFILTVPEATSSCGCGKSFSLF